MSAGAEAVRVVCRCRPARNELIRGHGQGGFEGRSDEEKAAGKVKVAPKKASLVVAKEKRNSTTPSTSTPSLAVQAHHSLEGMGVKFHPDGKSLTVMETASSVGNTKESSRPRPHLFTFDHVFDPNCTQEDVFQQLAKDTVKDVLRGYNGSIFAYGQTGSGKTFTMFGPSHAVSDMRGVIPRCAEELFAGLDSIEELEEVTIKCSFLEIYKEVIQDLLHPNNANLRIREEKNGEVYVQGLSDEYVSSAEDILHLLAVGEKSRTVASTDMNEVSSRSHSVLIIVVNQKLKDGSTRVGKLNMADLAGSERIERTNATGVTLEEAKMINQSLSALGNCINALTDSKRTHIPFRDSTLTFLLKDSLGGNTKTTLLVCCSGEDSDIPETLSTLNFAKRAKRIKNQVTVNTVLGVKELTGMIEGLKRELALAMKQIVALQKVVRMMRETGAGKGEGWDEAMMDQLMKPPVIGRGAEGDGKPQPSRPATPVSGAVSAITTAINSPLTTAPPSPTLAPLSSSISAPQLTSPHSPPPPIEVGEGGEVDIAQIRQMISAAREEARAINGENELQPPTPTPQPASPAPPSPSPTPSPTPPPDPSLHTLESQLALERAEYRRKAKRWHLENSQLRVEKEMLRVSARASDALISNLTNTVRAQKEREARRAGLSEERGVEGAEGDSEGVDTALTELLEKNERLEAQMAEMKGTWTAYMDLMMETQKVAAHRKEEKDREKAQERAQRDREAILFAPLPTPTHRTRVVKPVRVGEGASRIFSPPKVSVPFAASPLALPSKGEEEEGKEGVTTTPPPLVRKYSGPRTSGAFPTVIGSTTPPSSSSPTPSTPHSSLTSSLLSSLLDPPALSTPPPLDVLKRGFLYKKQMGWSMSMSANKAWRRRLFLLRPHCVDYYEFPTTLPVPPPSDPSAPPPPLQSAPSTTAGLMGSLRGTIPLDPTTLVRLVDYPDVPYGFEVVTRDKEAKLHAVDGEEREEWVEEVKRAVYRIRRGVGMKDEEIERLENLQTESFTDHPSRAVEL